MIFTRDTEKDHFPQVQVTEAALREKAKRPHFLGRPLLISETFNKEAQSHFPNTALGQPQFWLPETITMSRTEAFQVKAPASTVNKIKPGGKEERARKKKRE